MMERTKRRIMCGLTAVFLVLINLVEASKGSSGSTLNLPCKPYRTEISFPAVVDGSGHVTSQIFQENLPQSLLKVRMKWRRRPLEIMLFENDINGGGVSEWDDGNTTFADVMDKSCFFQGYIKDQPASYVALSTCGGLNGYIQTDEEMLFIEPRETASNKASSKLAHIVYTCEPSSREQRPPGQAFFDKPGKRRRRRAAVHPKYLEVQVVIDHSMVEAVGSKEMTENYVMTLMNIANTVFQHKTLGVNIKVVVVKIIYLTESQQRRVVRQSQPLATVNNFCQWSVDNVPWGRKVDYDISVLITKVKLGPSGFAPITGLCNPIRSCAVVHDEGFTTGFVIAHEMAHVFGLFHDGRGNNCGSNLYKTAIMAEIVEAKLNHFWWSECSSRRMQNVVRFLPCINNKPKKVRNHYPLDGSQRIQSHLGKSWSLDFQCKMDFGEYFGLCYSFPYDNCHTLWCSTRNNPRHCRTKRGPPLTGSVCGRDKECHNSRCQYVGNRKPINGKWSEWASWSECSNGCGVGIRQRTRACDNPAAMFDGKDCVGEQHMWDTCYNRTCHNFEDVREGECNVWDSVRIRPGKHKWMPSEPTSDATRCKQTCKSFYTAEVVTIDVDVADGTPCSYLEDTDDVCMAGKCIRVGCDGKMNSTTAKKRDACGICGGDDSECKVVQGEFNIRARSTNSYMEVIMIPAGAKNISIKQNKRTFRFLALKDVKYGKFVMNGKQQQSKEGMMVIKGTLFDYKRSNSRHMESIEAHGPLMATLSVMVLPSTIYKNISISYSYTVHRDDFTLEKNKYKWKFQKWSPCSVTCGNGVQTIVHGCIDKETKQLVDKEKCTYIEEPRKDQVKCTRAKCGRITYNYAMLNEFSACDAKCGQSGTQSQLFMCERVDFNKKYVQVDMKYCNHLPQPKMLRKCKGEPCQNEEGFIYQWATSKDWSKCKSKKKCGGAGEQSREVYCIAIRGGRKNSNETVDDRKCNIKKKPESSQTCKADPCPETFRWKAKSEWSVCPCGKEHGKQNRSIVCERVRDDGTGKESVSLTSLSDCDHATTKPETERSCKSGPCPPSHDWKIKDGYGPCNAECGETGMQKAKVVCQQEVIWKGKTTLEFVPDSFCKGKKKPEDKACQGLPCKPEFKWKETEQWTDCQAKCDETATQYKIFICERSVKNMDVVHVTDSFCNSLTKGNVTKQCTGPLCPLKWQIGEWSECSVTCGRGKRFRKVFCGDPDSDMDDVRCKDEPPRTSQRCELTWCPAPKRDECKDTFSFCLYYSNLEKRCKKQKFKTRCCNTCYKAVGGNVIEPPKNSFEKYQKKRGLGRWRAQRRRR